MKKPTPRSLILPILTLMLAASALPPAAAQVPKPEKIVRQDSKISPGRYRSQGRYRGAQNNSRPPVQNPWRPEYYSQNKYFQLNPGATSLSGSAVPFTGSVPRSGLVKQHGLTYNIVTPRPVLPVYGSVYVPYDAAPEPPPPPAPQIYVVQPPPVQAAPQPAAPPPVYEPPPPPPPAPPVSNEPGELTLAVVPAGTRILINDRFVGTAESLVAKGGPLVLKPGVYVLEAEHPDHTAQRLVFGVRPEERTRVIIDLTQTRPGRRARVDTGDDDDFLLN